MSKALGVLAVVIAVFLITASIEPSAFLRAYTQENLLTRITLYGVLGVGVSFVIISGGIDLSIGSVVGLVGCVVPLLLSKYHLPIPVVLVLAAVISLSIGLIHGLLITKVKLQPFVVTLCGLLIYRGLSRWLTADATQGYTGFESLRSLALGYVPIPLADGVEFKVKYPFFILTVLAVTAAVFLNRTVYGRYLLAMGRNEQAARYSGINTDRVKILAYVICSGCAGLGGLLFSLDLGTIQPASQGNFYELYAIAAAVLGGCSLRGGEGSIFGVLVGTALIQLLYISGNILGIPSQLEFATIGAVILSGVVIEEIARRISAARRLRAMQTGEAKPVPVKAA